MSAGWRRGSYNYLKYARQLAVNDVADSHYFTTIPRTDSDNRDILAALVLTALALMLRYAMAPQLDGLDDGGYLEAAQRVARGQGLENMFPLFRTRVGMAYPLGWLLRFEVIAPGQFWILTTLAELVTLAALFAGAWWLSGAARAGLVTVLLYTVYPFAVQQSAMFYPSAFQTMFIAISLALIIGAERAVIQSRTIAALAAGAALGLAYLVKEDAALLVPAVVVASMVTGFPRRSVALWLCVGAASIFFTESAIYLMTTGNATFRLTATSALEGGSTISNQLQISSIFRSDAYLRSLFLVPIQVGIVWWLLIPSVWNAVLRGDVAKRFLAALFLIVAAYLQFGSASISSYAPLPKTPRYAVIVTPVVMMLVGAWIADLYASRRKPLAVAIMLVMAAVSVPCIVYLGITSSERSRNTFTVAKTLQGLPPAPLYTDFYSARGLRVLAPELPQVKVWYHANFQSNEIVLQNDPDRDAGAYVLLDLQSAKIYTSSYQMTLPATITGSHPSWVMVWQGRAYESNSLGRRLLETGRTAVTRILPDTTFSRRVQRSVADIIDGDEVTLFRVE
jgi:hypothetical protein